MQHFKFTGFTVNNFRIFNAPAAFPLAPLTILTGKNNSGKSSFHKALRLLQASYKTTGLRKLAFMHPNVNIGDFESARNHQSNTHEMTFTLSATYDLMQISQHIHLHLSYKRDRLRNVSVLNGKLPILSFGLTENGMYKNAFIHLTNFISISALQAQFPYLSSEKTQEIADTIAQTAQRNNDLLTAYANPAEQYSDVISNAVHNFIGGLMSLGSPQIHHGDGPSLYCDPTLFDILGETEPMLNFEELKTLYLRDFIDVRTLQMSLALFPNISQTLFDRLIFIDNISLLPQPVYTASAAPSLFHLLEKASTQLPRVNRFLREWLVEKFALLDIPNAGENFFLIRNVDGYGYRPQFKIGGNYIDLSKMGKGITQLMPLLLTVFFYADGIFVVEEPETNLHPAAQSLLANFFTNHLSVPRELFDDEYSHNQFIIETHSEYLVRKLKYLTAAGTLQPQDSVIFYFNGTGKAVKSIRILEDGSLSDEFGAGFFDVAEHIDMSIARLGEQQRN